MSDKIKVLVLADYGCSTGFGQVASNIMQRINATGKYDITVIGINYDPVNEIDPERWPGRVIPAVTVSDMNAPDVYGRQKVLNELGKGIYDIFFTIQDTFIIGTIINQILETQEELEKKFSTIFYYPIDAAPKKEWIEKVVNSIDFPVPYTYYAKAESIIAYPEVEPKLCSPIYHGTNLKDFYRIEDRQEVAEFRKQYFDGKADGKFLITNINRNQPRKDILRSFMVLKELRNRGRDNALLYLHMAHDDAGGNLLVMADHFGFKLQEDFIVPSPRVFNPNQGLPLEVINRLYNASDCVLTTTLGEGWGLSATEALATRTPLIAPSNTSLTEMLADNRAYLVSSGKTISDWMTFGAQDNERVRPLMDVHEAADAIEQVMDGHLPDLDAAQAWAEKYSWDYVCEQWVELFEKAAALAKTIPQKPQLSRQQRRAIERQAKKKKVAI
jgi:glycosyltransferase involved in cell wall biosynthesis